MVRRTLISAQCVGKSAVSESYLNPHGTDLRVSRKAGQPPTEKPQVTP
jgi:hypothetical protein